MSDLFACKYKIGFKVTKYEPAFIPMLYLYAALEQDIKLDYKSYLTLSEGKDLPEVFYFVFGEGDPEDMEKDRLDFLEFLRENDPENFPVYISLLQAYTEFVGKEANRSFSKVDAWIKKLEDMEDNIPSDPETDYDVSF